MQWFLAYNSVSVTLACEVNDREKLDRFITGGNLKLPPLRSTSA